MEKNDFQLTLMYMHPSQICITAFFPSIVSRNMNISISYRKWIIIIITVYNISQVDRVEIFVCLIKEKNKPGKSKKKLGIYSKWE